MLIAYYQLVKYRKFTIVLLMLILNNSDENVLFKF